MAILSFFDLLKHLLKNESNFINDKNNKITFSDIAKSSFIIAEGIKQKYTANNYVFLQSYKTIDFVKKFFGIILSNNIPIVINPNLNKNQFLRLKEDIQHLEIDFESLENLCFEEKNFNFFDLEKPAMALLTSGSEGNPKVVIMSHRGIFNNINSVIDTMDLKNPENVGIILPLYHSFALITQLLTTFVSGGNIFLSDTITYPEEIESFIFDNKINTISGVPSNFNFLISYSEKAIKDVKHITCAGASLEINLSEKIEKKFPNANLWVGYGLTEAGPRVTAINNKDNKFKKHSVGKPIFNTEIEIIDEEVVVKSNSLMLGYLNHKSENIKDSKLFSGDTGYIDDDGYLYITGRKDNVFLSNGEKIYPQQIEKVLNTHESILSSAIYGEYCDISGNKIVALIKLKDNQVLNRKELIKHCRANLDNYMVPYTFFEVDSLPMTDNGKIRRKDLKEWIKKK